MKPNLSLKPVSRHHALIPYFVLGIAIAFSAVATHYVATVTHAKDKLRFDNAVQRTQDDIQTRLATNVALLRAGSGLFAVKERVSREEFHVFIERLELETRFPGIQGIGFAQSVTPSQKDELATYLGRQGIENFQIKPDTQRSEYYPIVYLEPLNARNKVAIGYDMFTEPIRRAAMAKARDTGIATASGKVTLVQEIDKHKQAGFLIYLPVYRHGTKLNTISDRRAALLGFVYSPFRANDLMAGIFGSEPNPVVDFQIYDGTKRSLENLLYSSGSENTDTPSNDRPRFTDTRTVEIAGRSWTIYFTSSPEINLASGTSIVPFIGIGGLLISFVLFGITRSQVKARYAAEIAAHSLRESERALRESELRLQRLVDANIIGIIIGDTSGRIIEANDAFLKIVGYSNEQITAGQANWLEITPLEYRHLDELAIREMIQTGSHTPYEKEYIRSDGTRIPVLAGNAYLGGRDNLCVGFLLDLTPQKQAEAAMRQSEERLRYALEAADMMAWEWCPTTDKAIQSQNVSSMFGLESGKGVKTGSEFFSRIHPDERESVVAVLKKAFTEKTNYSAEFRVILPDGCTRWMADQGRVICDRSGQPILMSGVIQDITERKQAEQALKESEDRFRKLAEKISVIPWEADAVTGNFTYVGPQAADILGYAIEDWYKENFWCEHIHPEDREWAVNFCVESSFQLDNYEFEYKMLAANGQAVWLYDLVSVVREQEQPKLLRGIMIDITERKQVEAERLQLLQREQAAREAAESANQMKDEFLATLSHELRTPLNAILGWTSLLLTRQFDRAITTRALETIDRNTRLLNQLIEDLLDVSRIMTGKLHLDMHPVEVALIINDAIEAVQPAATAKNIQINLILNSNKSSVFGDPTRLQQIVWNLLTNAIKFTPEGGQVEVRLSVIEGTGNREQGTEKGDKEAISHSYQPPVNGQQSPNTQYAQIQVIDTGIGINPKFLPHIFERFRQADSSITRSHGGLGLGLAIVRNLVELHGGSIRAESKGEGQGAKFIVELPLIQEQRDKGDKKDILYQSTVTSRQSQSKIQNPKSKIQNSPPPLNNLSILVVDDEADVRELLTTVLTNVGAKVTAVSSAYAALNLISENTINGKPDILISDIGMPEEDGYSLIRKIRELTPEQGGNIPAIALTAYARAEDKVQALEAGFQIHLPKPVVPEQLITLVANLAKC